jgi:hypothetical protein
LPFGELAKTGNLGKSIKSLAVNPGEKGATLQNFVSGL